MSKNLICSMCGLFTIVHGNLLIRGQSFGCLRVCLQQCMGNLTFDTRSVLITVSLVGGGVIDTTSILTTVLF